MMLHVVVIVQVEMVEVIPLVIIFYLLSLLVKEVFPIAYGIGQLRFQQAKEFSMPIPFMGDQHGFYCVQALAKLHRYLMKP